MTQFAILRFEKLKTQGEITAAGSHAMRTRPTANADPARLGQNRILAGTSDPAADMRAKLGGGPHRKNGVLVIEALLTTSPEWFDSATKEAKREWLKQTRAFLADTFGAANLAHVQLHVDESTPHVSAFIIPRDPASGRLNAARWLDGSAKLAKLQDEYAARLKPLGLARGLEGSKASHTTVRQFYGAMSAEVPSPPLPVVPTPPVMLKESTRQEWAATATKAAQRKAKPKVETLKRQARGAQLAERKAREYQTTSDAMRDAAKAARDLPLQGVAERLGLARDPRDKSKWIDAEGRFALSINEAKWFDHKAQAGKGGAIDLTMHVLGTDFKGAVAWLGHNIDAQAAGQAYAAAQVRTATRKAEKLMAERPAFSPPATAPERWPAVRSYLTGRGLSQDLVAQLRRDGKVWADARGNAVFAALDAAGAPRGAELKGTGASPFSGLAVGSSREDGAFTLRTAGAGETPRSLVLCESAIDAISWAQMNPQADALVASVAGVRGTLPRSLAAASEAAQEVVVAFDADGPGESFAERLMTALRALGRQVRRAVPLLGKDWNDELKGQQHLERERRKTTQPPQGEPFPSQEIKKGPSGPAATQPPVSREGWRQPPRYR